MHFFIHNSGKMYCDFSMMKPKFAGTPSQTTKNVAQFTLQRPKLHPTHAHNVKHFQEKKINKLTNLDQ